MEKLIGELFQEACRSDEWRAALIVHEKYKRKYHLDFPDLRQLREYITDWAIEREANGKKVNKDILTQECSRYIKEKHRVTNLLS